MTDLSKTTDVHHAFRSTGRQLSVLSDPDTLLTETELAEWQGRSPGALRQDRFLKRGVPYVRHGRRIFYRVGSVREWLRDHEVNA